MQLLRQPKAKVLFARFFLRARATKLEQAKAAPPTEKEQASFSFRPLINLINLGAAIKRQKAEGKRFDVAVSLFPPVWRSISVDFCLASPRLCGPAQRKSVSLIRRPLTWAL